MRAIIGPLHKRVHSNCSPPWPQAPLGVAVSPTQAPARPDCRSCRNPTASPRWSAFHQLSHEVADANPDAKLLVEAPLSIGLGFPRGPASHAAAVTHPRPLAN